MELSTSNASTTLFLLPEGRSAAAADDAIASDFSRIQRTLFLFRDCLTFELLTMNVGDV